MERPLWLNFGRNKATNKKDIPDSVIHLPIHIPYTAAIRHLIPIKAGVAAFAKLIFTKLIMNDRGVCNP